MGAVLNFDNTCRRIVGIDPDELDHGTPKDLLREGSVAMAESFVAWMRDDHQEEELYDLLMNHTTAGSVISSLQERWSEQVLKGEW